MPPCSAKGVKDPETHLAMIRQDELATLLASNQPFTPQDLEKIRTTSRDLNYQILYLPGEELGMQQLQPVLQARTLARVWRRCVPPIILIFLRLPILPLTFSALCASMPFPESCEFPACIGRCCFRFCI